MHSLNAGPVPLYHQLKLALAEDIKRGVYKSGDRLPSEPELIRQYGISRITVRQALDDLEAEGLILRRHGKGTYVAEARIEQELVRLTDFVEDMERAGQKPSSRVLAFGHETALPSVAQTLGIAPGSEVVRLDRLRLGDGRPVAYDSTWLPLRFGELLVGADLTRETIYHILETRYAVSVLSGSFTITASEATLPIAGALEVPVGSALLVIERTSYTGKDEPVYVQKRYYRPDRVQYRLTLSRYGEQGGGSRIDAFGPVFGEEETRREEDTGMNASSETWQLGDRAVQVSHLEKIYWAQTGFTKGDLLRYYRLIAPVALPYLKDRPVTLRVYPLGVSGTSYYLRDCPEDAPDWLRQVQYQPKTVGHPVPLPLIDNAAGLLWFANQGAIEFHLWGSHTPNLSQPDLAIFDLDPGESASFDTVREAALRLHDALERAGIRAYPKTSGGRGLHVFVPLGAGHTFERVRAWVKAVGQQLASNYPDLVALTSGATHQGGRVTVDYAQNSLGRNTAAPYTLRAHPAHPTVSTPLTWEELDTRTILPADLTPQVVLARVEHLGDLFAPVLHADQFIA